jgi:endoglucanase
MTNAHLLSVSGRWLGRTALCLLAAAALLPACTTTDSTRSNNPSGGPVTGNKPVKTDDPGDSSPLTAPPEPPKATGNQLASIKLWVDPHNNAKLRADAIRAKEPEKAALLDKIGNQPQALWLGEWNTNIYRTVRQVVEQAKEDGAVAQFVAYNVPHRDCGQESAGGLKKADDYRHWIRRIAAAIKDEPAIVILEPDALGLLAKPNCMTPEQQAERLDLLKDGVRVLRQNPKTIVYLDSGHAHWDPAPVFAERLKKAGIEDANGFALNTSNYVTTEENIAFGKKVSALVGGAHFVIDTSRNGNGATPDNQWCNPSGRKIGKPPTTDTKDPLIDGFLWLKRPGESDGECNGGPKAGIFWIEQALEMAK